MAATIIDVAREAGVSKSTVSLVLNNSSRIKPETQMRVHQAAEALGYVPNLNARGLTSKKTNNLGVIIVLEDMRVKSYDFNTEVEIFSYDVIAGIPRRLAGTDYGLLQERFCACGHDGALPLCVQGNRVDGLFIIGSLFDDLFAQRLREKGIPTVVVGSESRYFDYVMPDIRQSVRQSVDHLAQTGHRRLCYINCPASYPTSRLRVEGFASGIRAHEEDIRTHWLLSASRNTGEGGYLALKELWDRGERPDAIVGANDSIALGALRFLYERRVRVPDDVSLVGYEDSVLSGYATPPLSSINIKKERLGQEACAILLKRISHPRMRQVEMVLPSSYVERSSVRMRE